MNLHSSLTDVIEHERKSLNAEHKKKLQELDAAQKSISQLANGDGKKFTQSLSARRKIARAQRKSWKLRKAAKTAKSKRSITI